MMSLLACTIQPFSATTSLALQQNAEQPLRTQWLGQGIRSKTGAAADFKAASNSLEVSCMISDRDQRERATAQAVSQGVLEKESITSEEYQASPVIVKRMKLNELRSLPAKVLPAPR